MPVAPTIRLGPPAGDTLYLLPVRTEVLDKHLSRHRSVHVLHSPPPLYVFHPRHTPLHASAPVTRRARRQRRQEREADPSVLGEHRRPVHARVLVPALVPRRPLVLVPGNRGGYIDIEIS